MKKATPKTKAVAMRPEYDFSCGVRGKYAAAFQCGTNVVLLDPDMAEVFPDSKSVNDALRTVAATVPQGDSRPQ